MNKLNRIKKVLSAELGTKFDTPKKPRFFKSIGVGKMVYSYDNKIWYTDEELTKPYFPTSSVNNSLTFLNTSETNTTNAVVETAVPGANPVEGNPNAVLETAADDNQAVLDGVKKVLIDQQVKLLVIEPPKLEPKIEIKGLNTSSDALREAYKRTKQISDLYKKEAAEKAKKELAIASAGAVAGAAFKGIGEAFGAQQAATDSNLTKTADTIYDGVTEQVKKMGPVGQIVGEALGNAAIAGDIIQGLGGGTDQMTTTDKWMDSSFFSWHIGMINGFGGKKSDTFAADKDVLESIGSSYGGTSAEIMDAASKSGKKYGLFSSGARKRANRAMAAARAKQNIMADISEEATDQRLAVLSMGELAGLAYSMMTDGGYNLKYTYAAKQGGTLEWNPEITLEWEPKIELNWELPAFKEGGQILEELEWVPTKQSESFKAGGTLKDSLDVPEIEETTQKNVIPEGALHKNKHHMEHAEGLTKKGIPVIDEEGELQAEIELNEIIFTLEVTKKLEEYYEVFYSEDSTNKEKELAALEAGKLLVYEILENTDDRTGLIESCKLGGSLTLKKSTDDLIEEALEWIPNIIVIEETIEEKPKKEKSEKELMKEAIKEVLIELLTK